MIGFLITKWLCVLNYDYSWNMTYFLFWTFDEYINFKLLFRSLRYFQDFLQSLPLLFVLLFIVICPSVLINVLVILTDALKSLVKPIHFFVFCLYHELWFRLDGLWIYWCVHAFVHQRSCVSFIKPFKINNIKAS